MQVTGHLHPPDTASGVSGCTATLESNLAVSYKVKLTPTLSPSDSKDCAHSSTPAWKIPWMEEPGGLQPMGSQKHAAFMIFLAIPHGW